MTSHQVTRLLQRSGGEVPVPWDSTIEVTTARGAEDMNLLEPHRALEALTSENASLGEVVEMHYFGGMTAGEAAIVLGRSVHVVRHVLRLARAWLRRELAR